MNLKNKGRFEESSKTTLKLFVKEVAKYFMNFLETDFKKRRIPKRNAIQKIQKGLKVGIDLEKYPKLKKTLFSLLNSGFKKESLQIKKGEYVNNVPKNLFNLIEARIKKLSKKDLDKVFDKIENMVEEKKLLYAKEYDKFLEETKEETKNIFLRNLIISLLDDLDKPLENLDIADENSKFQLETDITDSVFAIFENEYTEILQNFFQGKKSFDLKKELQDTIKLIEIKNNLIKFFENSVIGDAFSDIYKLYRNNKSLDNTEIYLYFYELSLSNEKFPVFYIPITILKEKEDRFIFQFEKRVFVNTKAIDFVVQEFNLQTEKKSTLAGEFDRILYINGEDDFHSVLKDYIRKIENFFELNKNVDLGNPELQKGMNLITSFSNKGYLFLFDKSDEALINDYEEILNDDGDILENFSSLLNGFIEDNPKPFMEEVADEWHEKDISQKLIFESPIPLNDEQKQVLMALEKPDCNVMILEGPPGTGKSHTITAIICKALLEEKSVLVLSDKKEALDVVEEKISSTLNKIRHEDDFQNPILRLGKTGNKFYKIVQGQTIQKINDHYRAYKHEKGECDERRKNSLRELEENIIENINYFEGIDIKDIEFYFQNFDKFSAKDWVNSPEEYDIDLLRIKKGIQKLCKHDSDLKIDRNLLNDTSYELLNDYQNSLDILSQSKTDFKEKNKNVDIDVLIEEFDGHAPYDEKALHSLNSIKTTQSELSILSKDKSVILKLFKPAKELDLGVLIWRSEIIDISLNQFSESKKFLGERFDNYDIFSNFEIPKGINSKEAIDELKEYVDNLNTIKLPIIGFLFKSKEVEKTTRNLKKTFSYFGIENPQNSINDIQQVSDLFNFVYEKIPNECKEKEDSAYSIFRILIDLLNNNNDEYLSDYNKIKKLQKKIATEKKSIESLESSLIDINDLEYEIQQVNWNIEVYNQIDNINHVVNELSDIIPNNLKIDNDEKCNVFFSSNIKKSLNKILKTIEKLRSLRDDVDFILKIREEYPDFSEKINLNISTKNINKASSILSDHTDEEIKEYSKHKELQLKLEKQFNSCPEDRFSNSISGIEGLTTARMTYFLDKRIIEYTQNYANEVGTLKNIIRKKQKFPKDLFQNLKKAFPCILAGIRDYAEFIPLEKNLFDLIIIDEASQVSIAQALPALVRGKQIIVLGDDKQFSNVKANNASKVTNQELRKRVQDTFLEERLDGVDKNGWLTKVKENFDIKNSILKFSRFIRNYECQLKKHFRCYPEIISYSDKYFYDNTLQCMKIRGKQIEDVIKIEIIDHDGKFDENKNTNELEINHIIKKLQEFKEKEIEQSLGIITPHREQVTLLFDKINELPVPERDWLFGKCKLKIMTFDTCQGEERDYIFYSMVATKEKDRLNWIFLKDFSSISDEIDGTLRSQRMNVGFSRAKECIHFVLSKPIGEFQGEIKNAMLHYKNKLETGKKRIIEKLDSKMEYEVDEIFHNTKFYKENKERIEFIPQFELGKYLKQLSKDYNHPNYRVDFLLIFNGLKIVIEYDGFKEHFVDREEVNESNYNHYMKDDDIYRQKVLEGYGYKFLRINRFNIGDNPIETLNNRLQNLVKKKLKNQVILENLHNQIDRLKEGNERACDNCGKIYEALYFPYKSVNHCINCYENEHDVVLHKHRQKLHKHRKKHRQKHRKKINKRHFFAKTATTQNRIVQKNQETNNVPLKFWYRDDIKPREMHDYFIDEKYVQVRADKALKGDAKAQNELGSKYYFAGEYKKAAKWYKKSAEQGYASAQYNLGVMYDKGQGVAQNYVQAIYWYKRSAEQGDASAQYNLGWMHAKGLGVAQNYTQAHYWYKKSAEQGHALAQNNLGFMYYKGEGVARSYAQAVYWFKKSRSCFSSEAQFNLGVMHAKGQGVAQNYTQAAYWYKKSAKQGDASAQFNLGVMHAKGQGVAQNYVQAIYWYKRSAEQGYASAQYTLGLMYDNGRGVAQNYALAVYWYKKSAEQGYAKAQGALRKLTSTSK